MIITSALNTYIYSSLFVEIKCIAMVSTYQKVSPTSCSLWKCQRKEIRSQVAREHKLWLARSRSCQTRGIWRGEEIQDNFLVQQINLPAFFYRCDVLTDVPWKGQQRPIPHDEQKEPSWSGRNRNKEQELLAMFLFLGIQRLHHVSTQIKTAWTYTGQTGAAWYNLDQLWDHFLQLLLRGEHQSCPDVVGCANTVKLYKMHWLTPMSLQQPSSLWVGRGNSAIWERFTNRLMGTCTAAHH